MARAAGGKEGWGRATAVQALGADEDLGPQWPGVLQGAVGLGTSKRRSVRTEARNLQGGD